MSKKFLIRKIIVIPMLVALMTLPSITTVLANAKLDALMNSSESIIISQVVDVQKESAKNTDTLLASLQMDSQPLLLAANTTSSVPSNYPTINKNFPELTQRCDILFGMNVIGNTKTGLLYTAYLEGNSDVANAVAGAHEVSISDSSKVVYGAMMQNPNLQNRLKDPKIISELKNIANYSFTDVKSSDWFAQFIPLSCYYGNLNGIKNSKGQLEFQGNRSVARSEWATLFSCIQGYSNSSDGKYKDRDKRLDNFELLASKLEKTELYNKDAIELIRELKVRFRYKTNKVLFLLDPPYYLPTRTAKKVYGKNGEFEMTRDEHIELLNEVIDLDKKGFKFILQGKDDDFERLYDYKLCYLNGIDKNLLTVKKNYAQSKKKGEQKDTYDEMVWTNIKIGKKIKLVG